MLDSINHFGPRHPYPPRPPFPPIPPMPPQPLENTKYLVKRVLMTETEPIGTPGTMWIHTDPISRCTVYFLWEDNHWHNLFDNTNGGGSSDVSWQQLITSGNKIATITINGEATDVYVPQETEVTVTPNPAYSSGVEIATIKVGDITKSIKAPAGGGSSYTAGEHIDITNNVISTTGVPSNQDLQEALDTKQDLLESGTNIKTINHISLLGGGNIDIQGGEVADSQFKSIVFKRDNNTPSTPTGGTYENPVPTGWSDGVPQGEAKLWMSSRWFYTNPAQTDNWSTPSQATDTADIDFEYSEYEDPGTPETDPAKWHDGDEAAPEDIWMAVKKKSNGIWGNWTVLKIKGEKGDQGDTGPEGPQGPKGNDGTSVTIKGNVPSSSDLDPDYSGDVGDGFITEDTGHLWVWNGGTWIDAGEIKGPAGNDGHSAYVHRAFSDDGGVTLTANTGTTPGKYMGMAITETSTRPTTPSAYAPWLIFKGSDGSGYEFIYKLTSSNIAPTLPTSVNTDDYVPSGWTDDPEDVSSAFPYNWMCYRVKKEYDGVYKWGPYKGSSTNTGHAVLFNKWSEDGYSPLMLDLSNEVATVNCDSNYNILTNAVRPTCKATLYYGSTTVSNVTYAISSTTGGTNVVGLSINSSTGELTFSSTGTKFNFSGQGPLKITVKGTDTASGLYRESVMTVTKIAAGTNGTDGQDGTDGADGTSATSYWIESSSDNIVVTVGTSGLVINPTSITLTAYKQTGEDPVETNPTGVVKQYKWSSQSSWTNYTSAISVTESLVRNNTSLAVRVIVNNIQRDIETIYINKEDLLLSELDYLKTVFGEAQVLSRQGAYLRELLGVTTTEGSGIEAFINGSDIGKDATHGKLAIAAGVDSMTSSGVNAAFKVFDDGYVELSKLKMSGHQIIQYEDIEDPGVATASGTNYTLNTQHSYIKMTTPSDYAGQIYTVKLPTLTANDAGFTYHLLIEAFAGVQRGIYLTRVSGGIQDLTIQGIQDPGGFSTAYIYPGLAEVFWDGERWWLTRATGGINDNKHITVVIGTPPQGANPNTLFIELED